MNVTTKSIDIKASSLILYKDKIVIQLHSPVPALMKKDIYITCRCSKKGDSNIYVNKSNLSKIDAIANKSFLSIEKKMIIKHKQELWLKQQSEYCLHLFFGLHHYNHNSKCNIN